MKFDWLSRVIGAVLWLALLNGCAHTGSPELSWEVLPSIPLECLSDANCSWQKGDSPFEVAKEKLFDPNLLADNASAAFSKRKARFLDERGLIEAISDSARRLAVDAQNPQGEAQKVIDADVKGVKLLPPRPSDYVKEAERYRASSEFLKCQSSISALEIVQADGLKTNTNQDAVMTALYTRYVEACFKSAPSEFLDRLAIFAISTPNPKWQSQGIFCLGFALDSKHVVTAKHCLADPNALKLIKDGQWYESKVMLAPLVNSSVIFAKDLTKKFSYRVSSMHQKLDDEYFNPAVISDDIAIVELDEPQDFSRFNVASHKSWDRILTFTTFIPEQQLKVCQADPINCNVGHLIRADLAATCVSPIAIGNCISHACQTRPGSSGGPILAIRDGVPFFVGVHTGSIDKETNAVCKLPRENYYMNYGISAQSSAVFRSLFSASEK